MTPPLSRHRRPGPSSRRHGSSVVLVLALLSITLAVSYAMLRSQISSTQLEDNVQLDVLARNAAQTGMANGLRRMHESGWDISTTLNGSAGSYQTYTVTYTTGDSQLTSSDPKYSEWPLRVTVRATGTATNPRQTKITATHTLQAVVALVPREIPADPSSFSSMMSYTVYQHSPADFDVEWPFRITGSVRLQDKLRLMDTYPSPSSAQSRYLSDLNQMRLHGYSDYRPFNGPVHLPYSKTGSSVRSLLTSNLGVSTSDMSGSTVSGLTYPTSMTTYRMYPGGTSYTIPALSSSVSNTTLQADPKTNPLGIFRRSGDVTLGSNVTLQGMLIATGDVNITGSNVSLQAFSATPLDGSSTPVQLPAVVCGDDFLVNSSAGVTVRGLVIASDEFDILPGSSNTLFDMKGRLLCRGFTIDTRSEWNLSSFWWNLLWSLFSSQLSGSGSIDYYPVWLNYQGLSYVPILTIAPETSSVRYHWQDNTNPLYTTKSGDTGLKWSLLRWDDLN